VQLPNNELKLLLFDIGSVNQRQPSSNLIPKLLADWSGFSESLFVLNKDEKKKPFFLNSDLKDVAISISHTTNWLSCALYKDDIVGIDIERNDRKVNLKLADRYFAKDEIDYLYGKTINPQEAFIRLWTLKEAYGKALGVGINQSVLATSFLSLLLQKDDFGYHKTGNTNTHWLSYEKLHKEGLILSYCSSQSPVKVSLEKLF
jgi:phosphopantetheinyl transferase